MVYHCGSALPVGWFFVANLLTKVTSSAIYGIFVDNVPKGAIRCSACLCVREYRRHAPRSKALLPEGVTTGGVRGNERGQWLAAGGRWEEGGRRLVGDGRGWEETGVAGDEHGWEEAKAPVDKHDGKEAETTVDECGHAAGTGRRRMDKVGVGKVGWTL